MTTLFVTKETGGRARMTPMTVVEPEQQETHGDFDTVATDITGNPIFLASMLSGFCAMERCGAHLYRTVAARTGIDSWRQRYEAFGRQTEDHVRILEGLIGRLHGDPQYVSPAARLEEARSSKLMEVPLLSGCADVRLQELTDLEAILVAERKCHGHWELLKNLAAKLPEGDSRKAIEEAVAQVADQEDEHVRWAMETWQSTMIQACLEVPL